ncbi:MAG: nuclear transport factor 2 family protein [Deltaproteobacteria bacterium]
MYRAIVRSKVHALFDAINRGDAQPVIDGFALQFEHGFIGDHALGGSRHSRPAITAWYQRLYRLMPDITFTLHEIDVHGTPWNTQVVVRWTETNAGTDNTPTTADGVHIAHLKWGKMTRLYILPDTVKLIATLDRLAAKGVTEAHAPPITD